MYGSNPTPATSEDIALASRWTLERMERDQDERREWHDGDVIRNEEEWAKHRNATNRIATYLGYRGIVETLILIVLVLEYFQ